MATISFDTLKFVEKLRVAGVPEAQAKAEAEALISVFAEAIDQQLATKEDIRGVKDDIAGLEKALKADFAGLEKATGVDIAGVKADIATLEKALKADIAGLEKTTKADIAGLEKTLRADIIPLQRDSYVIKWMMGMVLAGVMTIILKTFFPA